MFSICFSLIRAYSQMLEPKDTHSSHARPKTKTSDQLVGIADYMGASLEMNDSHTMKKCSNIQTNI